MIQYNTIMAKDASIGMMVPFTTKSGTIILTIENIEQLRCWSLFGSFTKYRFHYESGLKTEWNPTDLFRVLR